MWYLREDERGIHIVMTTIFTKGLCYIAEGMFPTGTTEECSLIAAALETGLRVGILRPEVVRLYIDGLDKEAEYSDDDLNGDKAVGDILAEVVKRDALH